MRLPSAQSIGYLAPPDQRLRDLARDAIARRAVDDDDRERLLAMLGLHDINNTTNEGAQPCTP